MKSGGHVTIVCFQKFLLIKVLKGLIRVDGCPSLANGKTNYTIDINADIIVGKFREQNISVKALPGLISKNFRGNIDHISSSSYEVFDTSMEIQESLEHQTNDLTECKATGKLCTLGYSCAVSPADHYTGVCVHQCDLEDKPCNNRGYCFFDTVLSQTACRCQRSLVTMYYGPQCEERTGTVEFVVGLSVGGGGGLILVIILILCCRRSCKDEQEKSKKGDYFATSKLDMRDFTSSLRLTEDSQNLYRYTGTPGVTNQAYERLWNQSPRVPELEIYLPQSKSHHSPRVCGGERSSMASIDSTRNFSIQRPHIYSEPMENFESPYVSRETHLYKSQTGIRPVPATYTTTENRTPF